MESEEEIAQLKLMVDQLKGLIRAKDEELQQKDGGLKDIESKLAKANILVKAKEAKILLLSKQIKGQNSSCSSGDANSNGALEAALLDTEDTIKRQLKVIKNHEREYTALQKQYEEKCAIEDKSTQDQARLEELDGTIANKDQLISGFTSRIEELEKYLQEKEVQAKVLQDRVFESETLSEQQKLLLDKLSAAVCEQEEKVAIVTEEKNHLRNDKDKLSDEVFLLLEKLKDKEGAIEVFESHIKQMQNTLKVEYREYQEDRQLHEEIEGSYRGKIQDLKDMILGMERVLELLQNDAADKKKEQEELQKTISVLEQNLKEAVESKELLQERGSNEENAKKDKIIDQLAEALRHKEGAYNAVLKQNDNLTEEKRHLEAAFRQSREELAEKWQSFSEENANTHESQVAKYEVAAVDFKENVANMTEVFSESKKGYEERLQYSEQRMTAALAELDYQTKVLETQTQDLNATKKENRRMKHRLNDFARNDRRNHTSREMSDRISNLSFEVEELGHCKNLLWEENDKLLKDREALTSSKNKLMEHYKIMLGDNESLLASLGKADGDVKYATVENGKLQIRVEELEEENENIVSKMKAEEAENKKRIHELQSESESVVLSWKQEKQNLLRELGEVESRGKDAWESEMAEKEKRIQELVENLEKTSKDRGIFESRFREFHQRSSQMEHDLQSANVENKRLKSELENLKREEDAGQKILKECRSERERLIGRCVALEQRNDELSTLAEKYKDEMMKLREDADESSKKSLVIQEEMARMKQVLDNQKRQEETNAASWVEAYQRLESQLEESSRSHGDQEKKLGAALATAHEEKDSLAAVNEDLKVKIKNLEENTSIEKELLSKNILSLSECLELSKVKEQEAASQALESEQKLKHADEERKNIEKMSQELEEKCRILLAEKTSLESQLTAAIASSNEDAQRRTEETTSFKDEVMEAASRIQVLEAKLEEAREESSRLRAWKDEASTKLEDSKQNMDEAISKNQQLKEDIENLKNLLDEKIRICSNLEESLQGTKSLQLKSEQSMLLRDEDVVRLLMSVDELKMERESLVKEHQKQVSEMQDRMRETEGESAALQDQLLTSAEELEKLRCQLDEKNSDVGKKIALLEQMSTQYAGLRSELEASHTEYKRLMAEMGKPPLSKEEATAEVQQEQHQMSVESELNEAKVQLHKVESERDIAVHEATLLKRLGREQSHDFSDGDGMTFAEEPSGLTHKGGLEYLQSQLEGLANEQEQQAVEHQRVTAALNDKIHRITSEKEQFAEAYQKQTLELEEVLKSFDDRNSECQQLNAVIGEQQRDLTRVREELAKAQKSSESREKTLGDLEEKFLQLQEKHNVAAKDFEFSQSAEEELELDLKETKSLLKTVQDQNVFLNEQVEKYTQAASVLQQDLDQAMEQIDMQNSQYNEDTARLKSLLRDKDQEISALHDDLTEKTQEITSLSQSLKERNSECSNLNDLLNAQTEKVGQLESLIRQREVELALISELQGEKEQAAIKAAEMTEYITRLEQSSKSNEATAQDLMKKIESLQSELIEREGALERLSRESSRIHESHLKKEEEKENCLTDAENQLVALKQQLSQSQKAIESLSSTVERKDEELTQLKEACSQRESQLFSSQEELANVQQVIQAKEASFRQMIQIETDKYEQAKSDFVNSEEKIKSELAEVSNNYLQLKDVYLTQKEEVSGLTQHLERQITETDEHHRAKVESLDAEIAKLNDQILVLDREKETIQSELFDSREEALQLREKVEALEKWENEASEKTELCEDLQSTCSLLNERLQESSARLRDVEQRYTVAQNSLSDATEKAAEKENLVAKLDEALSANTAEVRRLKDALSAESERQVKEMDSMMAANIHQRYDHIKFLEGENSRIQQLLSNAEEERDQLRNACTELEVEFDSARKEHELKLEEDARKHAEDLSVLNSLLEENRIRLREITGAREQDDLKEEAWAKTCSELESQLCQVREELDSSKLNLSGATEKEQELSAEVTRLNDQLNEAKEREESITETSAKHESQLEKVKKIVRGLQIQAKQAKQKVAQLEAEKSEVLETSQQVSQQAEQTRDEEIATMAQKIAKLESETLHYKSSAEEVEMLTSSLKERLLSSVQTFETFQKEAAEIEARLQQEIVELNTKSGKLQEVMNLMKEEKTKLENELGDLNLQLQNVERQFKEAEEQLMLGQEKNTELISVISEKDEELSMTRLQSQTFQDSIQALSAEKGQLEMLLEEKEKLLQDLSCSASAGSEQLLALQASINAKDTELTSAFDEIANHKSICENMSVELQNAKKEWEILENSLKENIQEVAKALSEKEMANQNLNAENDMLKVSLGEKDLKIENLLEKQEGAGNKSDAELADMKQEIQSISEQLSSKSREIDELSEICAKLGRELTEKNEEIQNAVDENENLKEVISNKENEILKLSSELDHKTEEIHSLANSIEQKSKELSAVKAEMEKIDQDSKTVPWQMETMQGSLQEKVDEMNSCLREKDEENASLNQKLMSSEEQVKKYQNMLEDAELTVQQRQESAVNNDEAIENLLSEVNTLKEKLAYSDDRIKSLSKEAEGLISILDEKNSLCDTLNGELRSTSDKSSILEKEAEHLKAELKDSRVKIEDLNSELQDRLKQSGDETHQLHLNLRGKEEEVETANQKMSQMQEEIARLRAAKLEEEKRVEDSLLTSSAENVTSDVSASNANIVLDNDLKEKLLELESQLEEKSKSFFESQRKLKASLLSRKSIMEKLKLAENKLKEYERHSSGIGDVSKDMNESLNQSFDSSSSASAKSFDESLSTEISVLGAKNSELSEKIVKLESQFFKEKLELNAKEKELETINLEVISERDGLRKGVQAKEEVIHQLRNSLKESEESNASFVRQKDELMTLQVTRDEERQKIRAELENSRAECEKFSVLSTSLQQQVDVLASRQDSLKQECERKNDECGHLQEDLSSLLDEKSKLEEDLQTVQGQLEVVANNLQKKEEIVLELQGKSGSEESTQENTELDNLRSLLNEQEERNSHMNVTISELEHELMKNKRESEILSEECKCLQTSLDEERNLMVCKQEEIMNLRDDVFKKSQSIENLRIDLNDAQSRMEEETESLKSSLSIIEDERNRFQEEVGLLEKKNEHDSFVVETEKIQLLQKTSDNAVKEKEQLRRKLKAALVSRKELILQEKQLKEEVETLKGYKEKFEENEKIFCEMKLQEEERNTELTEMRARREKDIRILKDSRKKISDLEKKDVETLRIIEDGRKEMENLKYKLSEMEDSMKSKESEVSTLESCNNDLNEMVLALEGKKKSLQKKLEEDVETIRNLQKELKALQEERSGGVSPDDLEEMQDRLEAAEWDKENLRERVKQLENDKKEKTFMLDKVLKDFEDESMAKQEETSRCDDLQKQLIRLQSDLDTLRVEHEKRMEENIGHPEDVDAFQDVRQENMELKDSLDDVKSELDKTRGEKDSLKNELRRLEDSLHTTQNVDDIHQLREENKVLKASLGCLKEEMEKKNFIEAEEQRKLFGTSSLSNEMPDNSSELERDVLLAKRTILEETIGQLKVTQPDNWEQEPGVKKLIDKLEYLAEKAAETRREAKFTEARCVEMEAEQAKMKIQWESLQETILMGQKTIDQQEETIHRLKERNLDLERDSSSMELTRMELLQVRGQYEHLRSSSDVQVESYEQILLKHAEEIKKLKGTVKELENERLDLKENLSDKLEEMRALKELKKDLDVRMNEYEDFVQSLKRDLSAKEKQIGIMEKQRISNDPDVDKRTSSNGREEDIRSSSEHSFSSVADGYSKLIQNLNGGNLDAKEMRDQHHALTQELISKEEELVDVKEQLQHLSNAYDEMLQKVELTLSTQTLGSPNKTDVSLDMESTVSVEQENLLRSEDDEIAKPKVDVSKELASREALISELVSDCKRLKTELEKEKDLAASLQIESSDLRTQAKSLACLRTQYEVNENHLKSELAIKDRLLQRQKEELDYSSMEQARLRKEFGAGSPQEVQVVLAAYLEDINRLKADSVTRSADMEEKILRIRQLEENSLTKQEESEKLSLELESLSVHKESQSGMIQSLQEELQALKLEKETLLQELEFFKDSEELLEKKDLEIKKLESELTKLMDLDQEKSTSILRQQEDAQTLKTELESITSQLHAKENLVETLKEEKDRALSDLDDKTFLLAGIQEEINVTRSKLQDMDAEVAAKDSALSAILDDKERLSNDLKKSRGEIANLKEENNSLKTDMETYKRELEMTSSNFSSFVETNKDRNRRLEYAERSLSSLTGELSALDDKYSAASSVMEEIRRKMLPAQKVEAEILVQSAQRSDERSSVMSLSPKLLKDKNPWVRLQRKMDDYEDALNWMSASRKKVEEKGLELEKTYCQLKIDYDGSVSRVEELQSSLREATMKIQESEMQKEKISQDAREEVGKRERALDEMKARLESLEATLNAEGILETELGKLKEYNRDLSTRLQSAQDHIQTLESSASNVQQLQVAEQKLHAQNIQLDQLLTERQQLGGQLNVLHATLQDYQTKYADLHAGYVKMAEEHGRCVKKCDTDKEKSSRKPAAPGGPTITDVPGSPEHKNLQKSLHNANTEKKQLVATLSQMENQLRDEVQRREEVEELLHNLRKNKDSSMEEISLDMTQFMSDEDEAVLLRPTSVTRKVLSSVPGSCARWMRGRFLRWANPPKARLCPRFRPLSFQTLVVLYTIGLHVLLFKCFLL